MFTARTNPFNTSSAKPFNKLKMPEIDYDNVTNACKKNLEAFTQTQKSVFNTLHSMAEMQTKFAHQAIEGIGSFMKNMKNAKTVEEKTQLQTQAFKDGLSKVVDHGRDVSEHITKTNNELSSKVGQTVSENINHAQDAMKKNTNKTF
ncbi:MAG: phasin family protein [Janthinobacterium lividum]